MSIQSDRQSAEARFRVVFSHLGAVTAYARRRGSRDPDGIAAEAMTIAWRRLADVPADEAPALPKGAKAPLKSGNAPKGYEIKGNADSGLYHEPDGQWYDATEPEFWFKSAEDAEAAGFTRAGGGTAKEDDK